MLATEPREVDREEWLAKPLAIDHKWLTVIFTASTLREVGLVLVARDAPRDLVREDGLVVIVFRTFAFSTFPGSLFVRFRRGFFLRS